MLFLKRKDREGDNHSNRQLVRVKCAFERTASRRSFARALIARKVTFVLAKASSDYLLLGQSSSALAWVWLGVGNDCGAGSGTFSLLLPLGQGRPPQRQSSELVTWV